MLKEIVPPSIACVDRVLCPGEEVQQHEVIAILLLQQVAKVFSVYEINSRRAITCCLCSCGRCECACCDDKTFVGAPCHSSTKVSYSAGPNTALIALALEIDLKRYQIEAQLAA